MLSITMRCKAYPIGECWSYGGVSVVTLTLGTALRGNAEAKIGTEGPPGRCRSSKQPFMHRRKQELVANELVRR
jgi:hypothetical protein